MVFLFSFWHACRSSHLEGVPAFLSMLLLLSCLPSGLKTLSPGLCNPSHVKGVSASQTKFDYVVQSMSQTDDPYSHLKEHLLQMYALTDYARYEAISSLPLPRDMLPSPLMSKILSLTPPLMSVLFLLSFHASPASCSGNQSSQTPGPCHHCPSAPSSLSVISILLGDKILLCDSSTGTLCPLVPVQLRRQHFNLLHAASHPGVRASQSLPSLFGLDFPGTWSLGVVLPTVRME